MTRLATVRVSQASAEQRRGRAGRLEPGLCYRLWHEAEQAQLMPFNTPEILAADLAPLALALALWGAPDPAALDWLDPPPAAAYGEARALLRRLGALDDKERITAAGPRDGRARRAAAARAYDGAGKGMGLGRARLRLGGAALERDLVKAAPGRRDADLRLRAELLRERGGSLPPGLSLDRGALERTRQTARQFERQLGLRRQTAAGSEATGRLVAQAYPDRLAQRRPGSAGQFLLANGRGAELPPGDALAKEEFLAVSDLDGERQSARIFLAAPIARSEIEGDFAGLIETAETVAWDAREAAVLARRRQLLGALVLKDEPLAAPPPEQVTAALLAGIRALGLDALPWRDEALGLRHRLGFLRRLEGEEFGLAGSLGRRAHGVARILARALSFRHRPTLAARSARSCGSASRPLSGPSSAAMLERLAPTHVVVPSGSRIAIDYGAGEVPVLAVRLQELFGAHETPAIAAGRVPLLLHLLSPAGRPLQVTRDLAGFWTGSYPEVRRAMRGRYPKHPWPEDPLSAPPTARAKRPARAKAAG